MCGILFTSKDSNRFNKEYIQDLINNNQSRGPDAHSYKTLTSYNFIMTLHAWVLALRGEGIIQQPMQDKYNNVLAFNGEIFDNMDISDSQNDTIFLCNKLSSESKNIMNVISQISGPFAFVYWQNDSSKLYFGRDRLGRRSLLQYHANGLLALTSVSANHQNNIQWSEVETTGIFCWDPATEIIECIPWPFPPMLINDTIPNEPDLYPLTSDFSFTEYIKHNKMQDIMLQWHNILNHAVLSRTANIPNNTPNPRLAILFSGGLDCTSLAIFAHSLIPIDEPIDLLNVAFENSRTKNSNNLNVFQVPDRETGLSTLSQLQLRFPKRKWNFVEINVDRNEYMEMKSHVQEIMYPSTTVMDLSIAMALWFAARGKGILNNQSYTSTAKVVLSGLGADEQLGGYSRHSAQFKQNKWAGLIKELQLDLDRIPTRNLGRDDRIISDLGKEVRFPFLDEKVLKFLSCLRIEQKTDLRLMKGVGDKLILRALVDSFGLNACAREPKRAIQFGSRTAKMEGNEKGHLKITD